ncbi:phage major capsid protein [Leucobacter chromiiresistens]|uniref:Phage major capsid protein, HK97 family n=1 Tax=Leucobacter chromiiresistens TaxID=1079994 RepID=A0A1H0Y9H5_9MICO|nr:phage major capsid protein [Leucobacter chromiiresistens]SDQ11546.1 phage major capsid protein, HK97 family [Leucobacter chromiiresistens]
MNAKAKHAAVLAEMQTIVDGSKSAKRDLTQAEIQRIEELADVATELKATINRQERGDAIMKSIDGVGEQLDEDFGGNELLAPPSRAGAKGHVFLTGARGRKMAEGIVRQYGAKSLVATGTTVTTVPISPDPIADGVVPTSVLEALGSVLRGEPVYQYLRQTVRENNAAIVADGDTKPTSLVSVEPIEGRLHVFAHISEYVAEYLLKDASALQSFLTSQLLFMLREAVEGEILNGDGTEGHLRGILNTSGVQTQAFATDAVTTLRLAALKLENVGHAADLFIVNSNDWAAIETQRVTSGSFDLGGPVDRATQKLWGTQVVTSTRIAAGTALALDRSAVGVDTDGTIETKWDQSSGFDTNQVRARVEGRFGLSTYHPAGIVKATLTEA